MRIANRDWREVWLVDFEFQVLPGERPKVICLVALELVTARRIKLFQSDLGALHEAPYAVDSDVLFVAYYASAELGCHLALGWPLPEH